MKEDVTAQQELRNRSWKPQYPLVHLRGDSCSAPAQPQTGPHGYAQSPGTGVNWSFITLNPLSPKP